MTAEERREIAAEASRAYRRRKAQLEELRAAIRAAARQLDPRFVRASVPAAEVRRLLSELERLAEEPRP
jgi:hypothetical protein